MSEEIDLQAIRHRNMDELKQLGFTPADWLPIWNDAVTLRPVPEIAARLMAMDALFTWSSAPDDAADSARVQAYIDRSHLLEAMTSDEQAQVQTPRNAAREEFSGSVGWRLENMWSLAWVLGFDPAPTVTGGMVGPGIGRPMIMEFLPGLDASVNDLIEKATVRDTVDVVAMHDLFYCAHNAVRSAQLGGETVPAGFDPIADGGTVHERRHSLTWCLSPDVDWDDTDLST